MTERTRPVVSFIAAAVCVGMVLPNGAAAPSRLRDAGTVIGSSLAEHYQFQVGSDVQSVTAGESLSGSHTWHFLVDGAGTTSLAGVQVGFDSGGSGADYTDSKVFNFHYGFFSSGPFGPNLACPTPSATQETCPSPAVTLPPGGGMVVYAGVVKPTTATPGFDASRTLTAIPSSTDSAVAVAVTLRDARYDDGSEIGVNSSTDDADVSSAPTVTANGQPLPICPQPDGTACVRWATFGAYQNTAADGSKATCESVAMDVLNAQVGVPYAFGWQENDSGSGCPAGEPGASVGAFTPIQTLSTLPCSSGTDCSETQSVADLGDVTTTVGPGQGITGFSRSQGEIYSVSFAPEAAPSAPFGTVSSDYADSTTADGTATATNVGTGTTATGTGVGALTVSQWGSDPVSTPPFDASGNYFDVQVLSTSRFSTVSLQNCMLKSGDSLMWWNGSTWLLVTPQSYVAGSGCVTATLSDTSSPTLSQLRGTIFAVTNAPRLSLAATKLVLAGTRVRLRLGCARVACRGTATLEQPAKAKVKPVVLGHAKYALAAGKKAKVTIALNPTGKRLLARVSRTRAFKAEASVTVQHGHTLAVPVQITR